VPVALFGAGLDRGLLPRESSSSCSHYDPSVCV